MRNNRLNIIKNKVNGLTEKDAKFILSHMISIYCNDSFGDPSFQKMDDSSKFIFMALLLTENIPSLFDGGGSSIGISKN